MRQVLLLKKRQEIGRGLRICVNQEGERVYGFYANTLTVMANESYEDFAKGLQEEIEKEEGIKFGVIEQHFFANIPTVDENDNPVYLVPKIVKEFMTFYLKKNTLIKKVKFKIF